MVLRANPSPEDCDEPRPTTTSWNEHTKTVGLRFAFKAAAMVLHEDEKMPSADVTAGVVVGQLGMPISGYRLTSGFEFKCGAHTITRMLIHASQPR